MRRPDGRSFIREIAALVRCFVAPAFAGPSQVSDGARNLGTRRMPRAIPSPRSRVTNGHLLATRRRPRGGRRPAERQSRLTSGDFGASPARRSRARLGGIEAARGGFASIKIARWQSGFSDDGSDPFAFGPGARPHPRYRAMPMAGGETYVPGTLLTAAEIRGWSPRWRGASVGLDRRRPCPRRGPPGAFASCPGAGRAVGSSR
jgi:hypothetical protein